MQVNNFADTILSMIYLIIYKALNIYRQPVVSIMKYEDSASS